MVLINIVVLVDLRGHREGWGRSYFIDSIYIERRLVIMAQVPNRVPVVSRSTIVVGRSAVVVLLWVVRTVVDVLGHVIRDLCLSQIGD